MLLLALLTAVIDDDGQRYTSIPVGAKYVAQRIRTKCAERAFSVAGSSVWDSLLAVLQIFDSRHNAAVYKRKLNRFVLLLFSNFLPFVM